MSFAQRRLSVSVRKVHSMGFTYIGMLVAVVIMGAVLGAIMEVWHTALQREKERELLFVGNQFRQAIELYYRAGKKYPLSMEDLLKDPRQPTTQRYLRKIYHDPMTGNAEWGLTLGSRGEITGVHSLSEDAPIKVSGFSAVNRDFNGAKKYSDWIFSYQIQRASPATEKTLQPVSVQESTVP